jgi:hypothetical protein
VREALGEAMPRVDIQQELDAFTVLDLCTVDPRFEHQSLRVDQQVALASFDHLATVVTALFATHAGSLDRLTVDDACAGLGVPLEADPHSLAQGGVHPFPCSIQTPEAEVVVDGLPGWEVVWQQSPLTAAADHIEDGLEDLA